MVDKMSEEVAHAAISTAGAFLFAAADVPAAATSAAEGKPRNNDYKDWCLISESSIVDTSEMGEEEDQSTKPTKLVELGEVSDVDTSGAGQDSEEEQQPETANELEGKEQQNQSATGTELPFVFGQICSISEFHVLRAIRSFADISSISGSVYDLDEDETPRAVDQKDFTAGTAGLTGAVCGATVLSCIGACRGLTRGALLGAAVGCPAAFFTCGLSIPVFAAVGAANGFVLGTSVGGGIGAMSGASIGLTIFKCLEETQGC